MTKAIIAAVSAGIAAGYFFVPQELAVYSDYLISGGLCLILFMTGLDMGSQGDTFSDIKKVGWKVLFLPAAVLLGSLSFAAFTPLFLPGLSVREAIAISAGLGWYSLAPMILSEYSAELSAVAFMANVFREVISIMLIPIVAKKIGFLEAIALPGSPSMDTCLPVIINSSHERITMYAVANGVVLSLLVPVIVPLIMEIGL